MVKKLLKFLAYMLFFIAALVVFIPKENLYFLLEKNLKRYDVVISNESVTDEMAYLHLENMDITTKEIESATVSEADITLLLLYNRLHFHNIQLSSLVDSYLPAKIENIRVSYSVLDPLHINAKAVGDFGEADVTVSIVDKEVMVVLTPSKLMLTKYKKSLRLMKKDENGEYRYAKTF